MSVLFLEPHSAKIKKGFHICVRTLTMDKNTLFSSFGKWVLGVSLLHSVKLTQEIEKQPGTICTDPILLRSRNKNKEKVNWIHLKRIFKNNC